MSKGVFSRLYDKTSYTGMYAERFAPGDPSNEEIEPAHAFELRPSMNMRIQARERLATSPRGVDRPKLEKNATVEERLQFLFQTYSLQGHGHDEILKSMLESRNFIKMMQECPGLVDGDAVTIADLDIIFVKCKAKTERRITYEQFLIALSELSLKAFPADAAAPRTAFTLLLANFLLRNKRLQAAAAEAGEPQQQRPRVTFKIGTVGNSATSSKKSSPAESPSSQASTASQGSGGSARDQRRLRIDAREQTPFLPRRTSTADAVDDGAYGGGGDAHDEFSANGSQSFGNSSARSLARALAQTAAKSPLALQDRASVLPAAGVALPPVPQSLVPRPSYDPPPALGYIIGNPAAQIQLGLFLDLCCEKSKRAFETLVGGVYKDIEHESPGILSVTLYNWVSPWTRGSLEVNEAAVAVFDTAPEHFLGFCSEVFNAQRELQLGSASQSRTLSSADTTSRAIEIAVDRVGVQPELLRDLNDPGSEQSGRANKRLQLVTMLAVQTGVKRSPTATVNGLVDNMAMWDWSVEDWKQHIGNLRG